ncbi:hypothetical protein [Streptomyces broussonetiae]|uniref:Uncharacterized protein n=1 Tax=Streptomyces broussonetiae TaxID=2686304 RepID=A0A6I6MZ94_9ACTN|nr:hypothetical protein [Streptomyces broussonetiae]QHA02950.1 hypothetical protein GQF42_06320 [Streptomyces broussonetiae]
MSSPRGSARPQQHTVLPGGRRNRAAGPRQDAHGRFREEIAALPGPARRIENPVPDRSVPSRPPGRPTGSVRFDTEVRLRRHAAVRASRGRTPCAP